MSRLYDRVMAHGCRPLSAQQLFDVGMEADEGDRVLHRVVEEMLGRPATDAEVAARRERIRRSLEGSTSADVMESQELEDSVVVSAEEVADYVATLPAEADMVEVLDRVAPPFPSMFVEFQRRPNTLRLDSWGVFLTGDRVGADEGWDLHAALVGEWKRAHPVGPLVRWRLFLDSSGRIRSAEEAAWTLPPGVDHKGRPGRLLVTTLEIPNIPETTEYNFAASCAGLLAPALFSISLMHCKNVDIRPVDPPERLSRKHERKSGRPLTRYYILDIQPMRHALDSEGQAQTKGLGHALHICRGHFKTFTEDAPLFGRHVGMYWWESQVRGKATHGIVEKDYRIRLDRGLGREYVEVEEHPEIKPSAPEHTGLDPDLGGRGLRAHNATQNLLAQAVRDAGHEPRRPKPDEPQFDLAWEAGDVTWVAEVKSITPSNEERQLRLGLGQVIRYRQLLAEEGRPVRAMVVTEVEPTDPSWLDLCLSERISLAWGPDNLTVE